MSVAKSRRVVRTKSPKQPLSLSIVKKSLKKNWQLYALFSLPLVWFLIFKYWPMYGAQIAFRNFRPGDTITSAQFVGMKNFSKFFNNYMFWDLIGNTVGITVYNLVASMPIPIIFALCLNATMNTRLRKVVQYVTYMPYFISTVVMVGLLFQLMNPRIGLINVLIESFGGTKVDFMSKPNWFSSIYVWSDIWQKFGWNSIIYISALSAISQELHEAAMIDGANRFQRILHIDIPGIRPTIVILLILNCGQLMNIGFEKIFLMQNALNLRVSQVISTYVYTVGLKSMPSDFSYGTAIDLFNSVVNMTILIIVNRIASKVGDTSLF